MSGQNDYMSMNMVDRIKAMIYRLEQGVISTGDHIHLDDLPVLEAVGYPSRVVNDGAQLLRALNDRLVHLANND